MQTIDRYNFTYQSISLSMLPELLDDQGCKIIISITDISKTVSQICHDNNLPQSSTYKKIKKLLNAGLITIEKISIDNKGKRVILYRSRIKSLEVNLQMGSVFMKLNTNYKQHQ
jgi:predicted transcriptional regulator